MRGVALNCDGALLLRRFHQGLTVADEDGVDLLNAATALLEAARTAGEMRRDRCAHRGSGTTRIPGATGTQPPSASRYTQAAVIASAPEPKRRTIHLGI